MKENWYEKSLFRWLFLGYFFVTVFFPLGFYTLLAGPSKWAIDAALKNSWSEDTEKFIQKLIILFLIIISLIIAIFLRNFFLSKRNTILRYFIISTLSVLLFVSAYFFTFQPQVFINLAGGKVDNFMQSNIGDSGQKVEFVMGAYPDYKELKRLKESGYTGIVSLLNELVLPAEPNLIRQEDENVKKVGIPLIRIPMLPWVSGNNKSIELIHKLAKQGHGKYFVHCYLGRDRVNVFRKIVKDMGAKSVSLQKEILRHIDDLPRFERGLYTKISPEIYLVPLPTDEEFFGYIVNGQFNSVVSLLDPKNPQDTTWITKEKNILARYGLKYINLPVSDVNNKAELKILFDSIPNIKRPFIIHKFNSNDPIYNLLKRVIKVEKVK
jgi:hypothetical protein